MTIKWREWGTLLMTTINVKVFGKKIKIFFISTPFKKDHQSVYKEIEVDF